MRLLRKSFIVIGNNPAVGSHSPSNGQCEACKGGAFGWLHVPFVGFHVKH